MKADIVVAAVIAVAGAMAIGQALTTGTSEPTGSSGAPVAACTTYEPPQARDRPMTFAVAGDTVTDWRAPNGMSPTSWVTYADQGRVELVGGWARAGVGTQRISMSVRPVDADVLILLTGTNDLQYPFAYDNIELSLQRTVDTVGARDVLVSSIPPVAGFEMKTVRFNAWLARVAYRHDWAFVDAGSTLRGRDCSYRPRMTSDGTRPTPEGARLIGDAIRAALTNRPTAAG